MIKNDQMPTTKFEVVNLYTEGNNFVAQLKIPPFNVTPKVLIWGVRTFVQRQGAPSHYNEVFGFAIPENWDTISAKYA